VLAISIILEEFDIFNNELKKIGNDKNNTQIELLAQYGKLISLTNLILQLNSMFEVYAFYILVTNVPITIFIILKFLKTGDILSKLVILSDILFCMFEIFALVM
jgi:hypothetical protein